MKNAVIGLLALVIVVVVGVKLYAGNGKDYKACAGGVDRQTVMAMGNLVVGLDEKSDEPCVLIDANKWVNAGEYNAIAQQRQAAAAETDKAPAAPASTEKSTGERFKESQDKAAQE